MSMSKVRKSIKGAGKRNATFLDLSGKNLTKLPPEIGNLTALTELNLWDNKLSILPPEISNLTALTYLNISYNQLTSLPPEIGKLNALTRLYLHNNQLSSLPPEIGKLKVLTDLDLRNNQLSNLPPEIGKLNELTKLSLWNNQLSSLPPEISKLNALTSLDLMDNLFSTLPTEIGKLNALTSLDLDGNPLTSPPQEIVKQGTKAVLAFLRDQQKKSRKQWNSKLLLVGEGRVGKTSLSKALRGEKVDKNEPTTHTINIEHLALPQPDRADTTMHLNCWDFGGQDIYHATHQFFLTDRSIFLLLWNAGTGWEQSKLYTWLDMIEARAPKSPVLIIATHIEDRASDLPIKEMKRQYENVKGYWQVSCTKGTGIAELREAIAGFAKDLPLMGKEFPVNWLNAAEAVRINKKKTVTSKQFTKLISSQGIKAEDTGIIGEWLHDLGDILYYTDEELKNEVILKPQWVNKYINMVLDSEVVAENEGIFTREHMEELWRDLDRPTQEYFLHLMERFDLSYRTLEDKDISIVVERLKHNPKPVTDEIWENRLAKTNEREIKMKFDLGTTVPAGVPTWFIARTHRFTTHNHWRYGALFADNKEQAHLGRIESFPHGRYLELTVRGPLPYNFFALMRDGLELTLDRFQGIKPRRTIPCPGHDGEPCEHEFKLENLEKAAKKGVEIMQCSESLEDIQVSDLLLGIHWSTHERVLEQIAGSRDDIAAFIGLMQREFLLLFNREQRLIESHTPSLFVLRPETGRHWSKELLTSPMQLQLYCQAPDKWHPTLEGNGGCYPIKQPAEWINPLINHLQRMIKIFKYVSPTVSIGPVGVGFNLAGIEETIRNDIQKMTSLMELLEDKAVTYEEQYAKAYHEKDNPEHAKGADLRAIRALLDHLDPLRNWGGLRKVLTPEGHYFWLCEHHAKEYLD